MSQRRRLTHGPLRKIFIHNMRQLLIFWIPCVLLIFLVVGMQIYRSLQYLQSQSLSYAGRVSGRLNEEFLNIESSANLLSYNYDVQAFMRSNSMELSEKKIQQLNSIKYQLNVIRLQYPSVSSVSIHLLPRDYYIFETSAFAKKETPSSRGVEEEAFARIQAENLRKGWLIEPNRCCYTMQIEQNNVFCGNILVLLTDSSLSS